MFKNAIIYSTRAPLPAAATLRQAMAAAVFVPCAPTQRTSQGWVPPRAEHGDLLEVVGQHYVACLQTEERMLPAAVIKRHTDKLADAVENETGRRPKGKRLKELKEQATLELLPKAFTRQSKMLVWIDAGVGRVVVDATSASKADAAALNLVQAEVGFALAPMLSTTAPGMAMTSWLTDDEPPAGFSIGRKCRLKAADGTGAAVRYDRHHLDAEEMKHHIGQGKLPTEVQMTWANRVTFTLTDSLALKGVEVIDVRTDESQAGGDEAASAFDADVAILTSEVSGMIGYLLDTLGGELTPAAAVPA